MNQAPRSHEAGRPLALDHQQLLVLAKRPGTRIEVLSGRIWLTEEGLPGDQFACAGEVLCVAGHGRVVVEGLGSARLRLFEPVRGWATRLSALRAALRRIPARLVKRPIAPQAPRRARAAG
jgi:hypothetical protein